LDEGVEDLGGEDDRVWNINFEPATPLTLEPRQDLAFHTEKAGCLASHRTRSDAGQSTPTAEKAALETRKINVVPGHRIQPDLLGRQCQANGSLFSQSQPL